MLRRIAGPITPDADRIDIDGRTVTGPGVSVPPQRRNVGLVFQDDALFPHLSVARNVGDGLSPLPRRSKRTSSLVIRPESFRVRPRGEGPGEMTAISHLGHDRLVQVKLDRGTRVDIQVDGPAVAFDADEDLRKTTRWNRPRTAPLP